MKITSVTASARRKEFDIRAGEKKFAFPYAKLRLAPTSDDPVVEVSPDPELGNEAFTYRLESGQEDTIHLDAVRETNLDAEYLQEIVLHQLTVAARSGLEKSGIGIRQAARQLGTSTSQLYRLLDSNNGGKSLGQLLALLHLVNLRVHLEVTPMAS